MSISYEDSCKLQNLGTTFVVEGPAPRYNELVKVFFNLSCGSPHRHTKEDVRTCISLGSLQEVRIPAEYLPNLIKALQDLHREYAALED